MKKKSIIFSILKSNLLANFIIIFQVFIMLFNILPNLNELQENNRYIKIANNSDLKNSLYYMNEEIIQYRTADNKKSVTNIPVLRKNKKRVRELAKRSGIVKSITPDRIMDGYWINNILTDYYIYDQSTMSILKPYLIEGQLPKTTSDKYIEVAVLDRIYGKRYKVGDTVKLKNERGEIEAKVSGKIRGDFIDSVIFTSVSNSKIPVSDLFYGISKENLKNYFVLFTDDNNIISKINYPEDFYTFQGQLLIYFKDGVTKSQIKEFTDKIDKENLGYFITVDEMVKEQEKINSIRMATRLEYFIMLIFVVIIALVSISFYVQKNIRKQLRIYLINGASKFDILQIFTMYFSIIYLFSIGVYKLFVFIGKMNVIPNTIIFSDVFYDYDISLNNFIIISIIFILISIVVSYLPIRAIDKNKYIEDIKVR
ncbi:hypothetical protein [Helcococcus kunzii]|uniref:hypothetical protein n=2 Tax=Helcococcus kunzii TaxID=40091 RepID=UPI001BAEFEBF|nr:hypothetical protein [Helcococcus kunzii]QUY64662.1 hypothetical protein GUI37_03725 [Helcococcus kunzii]